MTRRRGAPRRRVAFTSCASRFLPRLAYLYCGATVPFLRQFPDWSDHGETRRMSGRVLVTGGAGFIGSHIAEAYLQDGWEVVVLDDLSRGHERNVPQGRAVRPGRHPLARGAEAAGHRASSTRSTITRPRSTSGSRSTSPPSTRASTSSGSSTCSRARVRAASSGWSSPAAAAWSTAIRRSSPRPRPRPSCRCRPMA